MKLIKDGRSENKPYTCTCTGCSSVLEVTPEDIHKCYDDQRDGASYVFKCCVCSRDIWVNASNTKWKGVWR